MKRYKLKPPKNPLGYTEEELKTICKQLSIDFNDFNEAFGINTVAIGKDNKARYYRCDVERALYKLDNPEGRFHLWD